MYCGFDVGSTTCKYVLCADTGEVLAQAYARHGAKQAEKVREFLVTLETQHHLTPHRDRIFLTGSGAGIVAPLIGGKLIQEVVAVAAAVERLHPAVHFVSEIGGEDMKTIFFQEHVGSKGKQVFMQSACSGGTGTFLEKTARKLGLADRLPQMRYMGYSLHKMSSKCGIFAEADANTLVKAGVPIEEIIASLFEAVVYQNLATLTKGNTPLPEVLLLGGPNLFFAGLQEAWRVHLQKLWEERRVPLPPDRDPASLVLVPENALYYAALGSVEIGRGEPQGIGLYQGHEQLTGWIEEGQYEQKKEGGQGLWTTPRELEEFARHYRPVAAPAAGPTGSPRTGRLGPCIIGCDFGSTTAKAVCLSPQKELLFTYYALSRGNPIEDAKAVFRQMHEARIGAPLGVGITGYGAELLTNIIGVDAPVVETVRTPRPRCTLSRMRTASAMWEGSMSRSSCSRTARSLTSGSISGGQIPRSLLRLLGAVIVARMSAYIHQSHNVSVLMYHLVCPAKYRRVVFDARVDTVLKEVCLDIAKRYAIIFLEIGTDKDHVHLLIQSIPTYSPTKMVKTIKSITAREVLKRVPAVKKQLWGGAFGSTGYFISTVGRHGNEEVIRQYVKKQGSEKTYKKLHRQDVQMELF